MNGKVRLDHLQPLPEKLKNLYDIENTKNESMAKHFKKHIRQYNCLFQMTSFGAKEVHTPRNEWDPSVVIHGQIHHFIGNLIPEPDQQAKFLQIYFLDPEDSVELRMKILQDSGIQREIIEILETTLREQNPYITSLEHAKEQIQDIPEAYIVIDPDRRPIFEHERRFNAPIANEVSVIIPNTIETEGKSRHIVLKERGGNLQIISESHRSYDSFQYILFFPHGDDGWHYQLKMINNKKLTPMRYYAYRIMNHKNEFSQILRGG